MIDKATVDKIFESAEIVDVVSDFIKLKRRGVNYIGNCPFHNEKTPSFTVSPAKGIYKCFGCGKGGNPINFVMEHEQLSYVEALKWMANKYNIEIVEQELTQEQKDLKDARESMQIVCNFAQKEFEKTLHETEEGKTIGLKYFNELGFSDPIIKKFELGYCDKTIDSFTKAAISKGYKEKFLIETGLSAKIEDGTLQDKFSERVIYPVHNKMGKVLAFAGVSLSNNREISKYHSSPESLIYKRKNILYGAFLARKAMVQNNKCYIVNSYNEVLWFHQMGIENVVASPRGNLTAEQIKIIKSLTSNIVFIQTDNPDSINSVLSSANNVLKEDTNIKIAVLPANFNSITSFIQNKGASELNHFLEKNEEDIILFKTRLLQKANNSDEKHSEIMNSIAHTIACIPNAITQAVYVTECAKLLNIDENILKLKI